MARIVEVPEHEGMTLEEAWNRHMGKLSARDRAEFADLERRERAELERVKRLEDVGESVKRKFGVESRRARTKRLIVTTATVESYIGRRLTAHEGRQIAQIARAVLVDGMVLTGPNGESLEDVARAGESSYQKTRARKDSKK